MVHAIRRLVKLLSGRTFLCDFRAFRGGPGYPHPRKSAGGRGHIRALTRKTKKVKNNNPKKYQGRKLRFYKLEAINRGRKNGAADMPFTAGQGDTSS